MHYRPLGSTGIEVSAIGFGAWGIGGCTPGATSYGETDDRESLRAANPRLDLGAIDDAVRFNHALVKQPFVREDVTVSLDYDLAAFFDAVRNNEHPELAKAKTRIRIDRAGEAYADFAAWCREVVWWGNKKGAYLYTGKAVEKEIAGHY